MEINLTAREEMNLKESLKERIKELQYDIDNVFGDKAQWEEDLRATQSILKKFGCGC